MPENANAVQETTTTKPGGKRFAFAYAPKVKPLSKKPKVETSVAEVVADATAIKPPSPPAVPVPEPAPVDDFFPPPCKLLLTEEIPASYPVSTSDIKSPPFPASDTSTPSAQNAAPKPAIKKSMFAIHAKPTVRHPKTAHSGAPPVSSCRSRTTSSSSSRAPSPMKHTSTSSHRPDVTSPPPCPPPDRPHSKHAESTQAPIEDNHMSKAGLTTVSEVEDSKEAVPESTEVKEHPAEQTKLSQFELVELDEQDTLSVTSSVTSSLFQKRASRTRKIEIPQPENWPDPNAIDPSKTRLRDLFYVIPTKYPAPKYRQEREAKREEERRQKLQEAKAKKTPSETDRDEALTTASVHSGDNDTSPVKPKEATPPPAEEVKPSSGSGPQLDLELDEDGNIVIRQECILNARQKCDAVVEAARHVEGDTSRATYTSYRKKPIQAPQRSWSMEEMIRFYYVLSTVGTDFGTMAKLLSGRTREQIHMKYKSEVKRNPHLIDFVFRYPKKYNLKMFTEQEYEQDDLTLQVRSAHGGKGQSTSRSSQRQQADSEGKSERSRKKLALLESERIAASAMQQVQAEEAADVPPVQRRGSRSSASGPVNIAPADTHSVRLSRMISHLQTSIAEKGKPAS